MSTEEQIQQAASIIKEGGTVAFPTETVYGLGADALNAKAVAKIFDLKRRPSFDPLIVHIVHPAQLELLTTDYNDPEVILLTQHFWPGPLTLVLEKKSIVPDLVTAGLSTVGIRMPSHPIAQKLLIESRCPIAAPSANPFGRISPTEAAHVKDQLPGVDMILDGGKTQVGIESTIIKRVNEAWVILRHGGITQEALQQFVSITELEEDDVIDAPGMLKSHYSPQKPFYILQPEVLDTVDKSSAGLISFTGKFDEGFQRVHRLTESNNLVEYASHLFSAMHALQASDIQAIYAEAVPKNGIGIAIMDKLEKAAYEYSK
ncbi:MAG: threonylcarbamoyl-AMP synthase [Saprospiraceae bacterium]|nr:threonylcarbamoyl-AMP synthase [Saprospiraceae bacterium]